MTASPPDHSHDASTGRASLGGERSLAAARIGIGLIQGLLLYFLWRSAGQGGGLNDALAWPATQPPLFAALALACAFTPVMLLAAVGRLSVRTLALWGVIAAAALALLGWHDAAQQTRDYFRPPYLRFPVIAFSAAALFIAHHLIVPAVASRRWIADFDDYFDTAWKAGVQLVLSLGFTGAFWLLLFLGAALFRIIGLSFLSDLIGEEWFAIPVTCLVFAIAVQLTDVRAGLIRGVRTVALMLLSWLLLVITVLVAGFLAALPFTGLDGLWKTGSATALVLSAAAALIILVNTAYQDGREDNLPPVVLRGAVRVAAVLLTPLIVIAVWGLSLRIGQHGLTPDRIIASACALVGAVYAAGYGWAALSPFWKKTEWMKPLERANVAAAVLTVAVILALFSPLLDPARMSVGDQVARLNRGAVSATEFDYAFLRFDAGKTGKAALADLAKSSDAEVARLAKQAQTTSSRYDVEQATVPPRTPHIAVWPTDAALPAGFVSPVPSGDPRYACQKAADCMATVRDLNGDGKVEILLADSYRIALFAQGADGAWAHQGDYRIAYCGAGPNNVRDLLKDPQTAPVAPIWPDLSTPRGSGRLQPEQDCPAPAVVNP
ncbi:MULTISPECIES: DUF4153 domain-containing protein [unclassified Brevundimonas]|uniref:DUF4153 domain-containing protein n=1 Tax=unclassified Brevundimonas TaxID=2622653 RepID=UPI000CFB2F25|nr:MULTISPECIES: DUF4153 domain-containing protein [unclassified Brevundimonas]PRA30486.1 DUF4153 domain-containing protein [Brevundimonas sp. MYb27]PQZ83238.1 DUF4153 domain-containing protein [Brevundimonas sp. MYb31]PRB16229.1 DUF4153 domain-containing protein [Brevundimonas sp. MYb52]PRB35160.1 DUF4153 domain-containing protein [Brevundimonas sp. MYb46]PRB49844.1 DUF4153 domain-containing protein [Brevundimonas sp. MYb33]